MIGWERTNGKDLASHGSDRSGKGNTGLRMTLVHCSLVYSSQDMEVPQVLINR